ncbi:MAG TPA: glycosyltransferase [Solirubrobacteraceae bacterium]|nr:glycosyltransferase [Solirubrobacteraceae bacterium]
MSISSPSGIEFYRRLAEHAGVPFVTLEPTPGIEDTYHPVDPLATELLSADVCRQFGILPIAPHEGMVTIASSEPVQYMAYDVAAALTGRAVNFVIAPSDQLGRAIDAAFGGTGAPGPEAAGAPAPPAVAPRAGDAGPAPYDHETTPLAAEPAPELEREEAASTDPELGELVGGPLRLGELLVSRGLASADQVEAALAEQQRSGDRIGRVLVHHGIVDDWTMTEVIAQQLEIPVVDLREFEPEPETLSIVPEPISRDLGVFPVAAENGKLYVASDDTLSPEAVERLRADTTLEIRVLLAPRNDIEELMRRMFADSYSATATGELLTRFPEDCANRVVTASQRSMLILGSVAIVALLVVFPIPTLVGLVAAASVFYTAVSLYKLKVVYSALGHEYEIDITPEEVAALDERTLPVYTILVPLYKEAAVVPRLVSGMEGLDYPKTKLDIRLLCEEGDEETIAAIQSLGLPPYFKLVVIPDSQPKTKPKACNYGLLQAEGEYVVIFDAEDRPDPDQLKRVVLAYSKAAPSVTCIQCKLNYFNQNQNLLTRWFTAEYSMWFDLLLPGLDAGDVPIPLGGTSNHFITDRLIELGAWDPFNVTEDADLGIRLHKSGYQTAIVDSTTLEEANSRLSNWVNQRSRWIKGYIQTWLVHMRHPGRLIRASGIRSFLSFQLIVGGTFIFLLNPIFWLLTTVFVFTQAHVIREMFPSVVFYIAAVQLVIGNFVFVYLNVAGSLERRHFSLVKYALASPLYWGLMSIAAWRGFIQLFTNPFYWEKTEHGLDV